MHRIFNVLSKQNSRPWVVEADIKQCFDKIAHSYLLEQLKFFPFKPIIEKWLGAGYIEQGPPH